MINLPTHRESVIQNLKDAGCPPELAERFLSCMDARRTAEELRLLGTHRGKLLDDLHCCQKRIDCLDYLIYQIRKETER